MATLVQVKKFFESGKHGRPCPLDEIKKLSDSERQELCDLLDMIPEDERGK